jgi:hypothetical protein
MQQAPKPGERSAPLTPLPYHRALRDYLKQEEPELWNWFSSNKVRAEYAEAVRLDLLKTTYRLEPALQPDLYAIAKEVLTRLDLEVPVTFYQAQSGGGLNAALAFVPGEAHVILVGSVLTTLASAELRAVLGHELAHFLLFNGWDGDFLVVSEILKALSNDASAHSCHLETARLFRLYAEIFADRGAFAATEDALVTIATLVKVNTGLREVNAESYLRQAEEIFARSRVKADQLTHPEPYIRAWALKQIADRGESALPDIEKLIAGSPPVNQLDLLAQQKVAARTRELLEHFLSPTWFRTEPVLAHARMFFSDFAATADVSLDPGFVAEIKTAEASLQDYYCYLLLDFVAVDRDLEEIPLAAALLLCEELGLAKRFAQIVVRELGITKKRLANVERDAAKIVERARASTSAAS